MQKWTVFLLVIGCLVTVRTSAEVQHLEVGGSVQQYGAWYSAFYEPFGLTLHYPGIAPRRPIGGDGFASYIRADGHGTDLHFVEQRTRLHLKADLADNVNAFIEFDANESWGGDFRSDYRTGADLTADSSDDVEVYQAYVEANEMFGQPLTLKIGRQEMSFGSGWLIGTNPFSDPFTGLSFDAVRLTYSGESYAVDAWWSKLQDRASLEEDGDIDFYGAYLTCTAIENMEFNAYWMYVRDAQRQTQTWLDWPMEYLVQRLKFDNYEPTNLHTVGLRTAGKVAAFDWEFEAAYQFGNADALGALFTPADGGYGDSNALYDNWAGQFTVGYTFEEVRFSPRVYLHGEYYGGEDNRAVTFWEWVNPFHHSKASVSFNRLFSDYETHSFLDGSGMTNYYNLQAGVDLAITEKIEFSFYATCAQAVESFDWPLNLRMGYWHVPIVPELSFLTREGSNDLGWELDFIFKYAYSEDLSFEVGASHFWPGDAIRDGVFTENNGTTLMGGTGKDGGDYLYVMTRIDF